MSSKVPITCDNCGNIFERYPSQQRGYGRRKDNSKNYCSKKCQGQDRGGRTMVSVQCPECDKEHEVELGYYNDRVKRVGTDAGFTCSKECRAKRIGRFGTENYRDEYTPYRVYKNNSVNCRGRGNNEHQEMKVGSNDLDVEYLKCLWESQNGKCAISGFAMIPAFNAQGFKTKNMHNGSLDRIDSNLPYRKGNVQFVCVCINYMKNNFTQKEIVDFVGQLGKVQ